jgi:hypothetical protein
VILDATHVKFYERMLDAAHDPFSRVCEGSIEIKEKVHVGLKRVQRCK